MADKTEKPAAAQPSAGDAPPGSWASAAAGAAAPAAAIGGSGDNVQSFISQFQDALGQLQQSQSAALTDLRDLRAAAQAMLAQEANRLSSRLGPDHPRVVAARAQLDENQAVVQGLDALLEISNLQPPAVQPGGALVHGRVVDGAGRGIGGLRVQVESASGSPIRWLGIADTDVSGYYILNLSPDALKKYLSTKGGGLVTIRSAKGVVLNRAVQPLALSANAQVFSTVALDRLNPVTVKPPKAGKAAPPDKTGARKKKSQGV